MFKILWEKYKFNWEKSCFLQGKAPKFGPKLETTLVHLQISLYQIFAWNRVNWLNFSIINQTKTGYQDASPKHGSIWSNKYLLNGCFTSFIFFQQFNSYFVEFSWKNCKIFGTHFLIHTFEGGTLLRPARLLMITFLMWLSTPCFPWYMYSVNDFASDRW